MNELYRKYRPQTFSEVQGQKLVVKFLRTKMEEGQLPHVVLFAGPTGVGKTTLARILARELGCTPANLIEVNCASDRKIDLARDIGEQMRLAPMGGTCRVWLMDEVVQLPKVTQQALLTVLEDVPDHVYFLLCSSEVQGLLPTFISRCSVQTLKPLTPANLSSILDAVLKNFPDPPDREVLDEVLLRSNGSGRKCLQLLEVALTLPEDDRMSGVRAAANEADSLGASLAQLLFRRADWPEVAALLSTISVDKCEEVRRGVLGYATAILLKRAEPFAYFVIEKFENPWFNSGKAGLVASAFAVTRDTSVK